MSPKIASTFRIDNELLEALKAVKERDGMPISEQVRRALVSWVELRGVKVKTERKRQSPAKRS